MSFNEEIGTCWCSNALSAVPSTESIKKTPRIRKHTIYFEYFRAPCWKRVRGYNYSSPQSQFRNGMINQTYISLYKFLFLLFERWKSDFSFTTCVCMYIYTHRYSFQYQLWYSYVKKKHIHVPGSPAVVKFWTFTLTYKKRKKIISTACQKNLKNI